MKFFIQDENQHQSIFIPILLSSSGLDSSERPANRQTIKLVINSNPSSLYLDFLQNKNITSLLENLVNNTYNAFLLDKNVVLIEKKKTQGKIVILLDKNIALAGKKRTLRKEKGHLRNKMRCTKKIISIVGLKLDKIKLNYIKEPSSKLSNMNSIVRPISKLINTSDDVGLDSGNGEGEELSDESIGRTETEMIYGALIDFFAYFFMLAIFQK